jgi:hypothetical protein
LGLIVTTTDQLYTEEHALEVARNFVIHDETYQYYPMGDTLRVYIDNGTAHDQGIYNVNVEFTSCYTGYGHREGALASIQRHKGYVIVLENKVIDACLDDYWDMIKEEKVNGKLYPSIPGQFLINASAYNKTR